MARLSSATVDHLLHREPAAAAKAIIADKKPNDVFIVDRLRGRAICSLLGVPYEAGMLESGRFDHGRYRPGLGDWNRRSSRARSSRPSRRGDLEAQVPLDRGA